MAGEINAAVELLHQGVNALEPDYMGGDDAVALLDRVIEGEKLLGAAKTFLVERIDACRVAQHEGHRTTAEWLAARSGTSVGHARGVVETAQVLDNAPELKSALRDALISTDQASEIAPAAQVDPGAVSMLVESARVDGIRGLRNKSRQVTAAATSEAELEARHERIHKGRFHRRYIDRDGAACGSYRTTPEKAAFLWAEIDEERDRLFKATRGAGEPEPPEAYEVDALCSLADRDARSHRGKRMTALLRADIPAFPRGATEAGEVCEIAGIGPVPVSVAREALGDAILKIVITHAADVRAVVHPNRTVAATIRTALLWQHPECCVAGCHEVHGLQKHHLVDFAQSRLTRLDELVLICPRHHHLITHDGFTLEPRPDGQYDLVPPGEQAEDDIERGPPIAA